MPSTDDCGGLLLCKKGSVQMEKWVAAVRE